MIAFDLGLRSTGVAWDSGSDTYVCPDDIDGGSRLDWWHRTFRMLLLPHVGSHAGVESPFVHPGHMTGSLALVELHGVFRLAAHQAEIAVHYIAPSSLKKWATGSGRASKHDMVTHARWLRPGVEIASTDEADAVLIFAWLEHHLGVQA